MEPLSEGIMIYFATTPVYLRTFGRRIIGEATAGLLNISLVSHIFKRRSRPVIWGSVEKA